MPDWSHLHGDQVVELVAAVRGGGQPEPAPCRDLLDRVLERGSRDVMAFVGDDQAVPGGQLRDVAAAGQGLQSDDVDGAAQLGPAAAELPGFDAEELGDPGPPLVVVGEYERAFYGSQYAMMAPLFEHYGVQLWMPEAGGRVDFASEHDEQTMTMLGLSSKREITRTSIRVRTAMAVQTREQGRYLGGRPPYGYRLADAGPHPNKAHAAWGRRAHRLEPDPETAHVVRWIFAQRLAGHSVARIARALNEAGIPCPSAADPGRNPHRTGHGVDTRHGHHHPVRTPGTPAARYGTGSAPTPSWPTRPM